MNPLWYLFDEEQMDAGRLEVRHAIPYSDLHDLNDAERDAMIVAPLEPFEFSHTLADQIGGQLAAGFVLTGFFEDKYEKPVDDPLSGYIDTFIATRATKT